MSYNRKGNPYYSAGSEARKVYVRDEDEAVLGQARSGNLRARDGKPRARKVKRRIVRRKAKPLMVRDVQARHRHGIIFCLM
jgi:hypothetical protein